MQSPFPGMDPYIEGHGRLWEDFHGDLIGQLKGAISERLPGQFVVQGQVRAYVVLVETEEKQEHAFVSDVGVGVLSGSAPPGVATQAGIAVAEVATDLEPQTLRAFLTEEYRESYLEIYVKEPDWRLVTCIEILSPANKRAASTGWEQYLRKRQGLLLGEANLIEFDLLRTGTRMPMLDPWPRSPYIILVARREKAPTCRVWPAHFHTRLPAIPIPLEPPYPDIQIELQPLVDAVYARSRYHLRLDYTKPLTPPLSDAETAWLADRLRQRATPASPAG